MRNYKKTLFTITELTEVFDVTKPSLYAWLREGLFDPVSGNGRKYYSSDAINLIKEKKDIKNPKDKIHVFGNVKGGVGKSTITSQFLMLASMMGFKCLAIDLDAQAHLTYQLGCETDDNTPTIFDALIEKKPIKDTIISLSPNLSIIPSTLKLSTIELSLINLRRREYKLKEILMPLANEYDLIAADTNPSITILNVSMYVASDAINIVCATDYLSYSGLKLMFDQINDLRQDFKINPNIRVIPNLFDIRNGICKRALGAIQNHYGDYITDTVVRENTAFRDSGQIQNSIFFSSKRMTGREDIINLTRELIQ